jgi:ATP sulfurylase
MLAEGTTPPDWVTRPEVAKVLMDAMATAAT